MVLVVSLLLCHTNSHLLAVMLTKLRAYVSGHDKTHSLFTHSSPLCLPSPYAPPSLPTLLSPPTHTQRRFTWLLAPVPAGGGASNDPELLQALFNAAAGLCKALVKHITAALPAALKHTKGANVAVLILFWSYKRFFC